MKVSSERGEDGYIVAQCPALKSCSSQGQTREEALRNIREAVEIYLEETLPSCGLALLHGSATLK